MSGDAVPMDIPPTRREWVAVVSAAVALFALRMPFLPPTLEDIDSINFDLGVHDYNPIAHQPHPPGYPVFILLAKLAHPLFASHAAGLAFLSAVFGSLSVVPLYFLFRALTSRAGAALACVLTLMSPLVWFNAVRPMSDLTGFFAVITSQCLLLNGVLRMEGGAPDGGKMWCAGVVAAGLAVGVRLQALFLVGPMLLCGWIRHPQIRFRSVALLSGTAIAWVVPLIQQSGGIAAYARSFERLISDALPVEPLLAAPTIRRAVAALWDVLGAPWGTAWLAIPILLASAIGGILCCVSHRRALVWGMFLFVPYAVYHYLLQMSVTIRYAIPIVPLIALFASVSVVHWSKRPARAAAGLGLAFAALASAWTVPALAAFHDNPSPAARALSYLQRESGSPDSFVVAGHPGFARHLLMLGPEFTVLPSVPAKPWRPLIDYWKHGGRRPILFLRNPRRTTLLLMGRDTQTSVARWSWPPPVQPLMKGERPSNVELMRLDPPQWFAESGFLMTLEAGDPDQVASEAHRVYVRPSARRRTLMASGSIVGPRETRVALQVGDSTQRHWHLKGDFTVRDVFDPLPAPGYVPVSFVAETPVLFTDIWVERDDQPAIRPARGFYFAEPDPETRRFRWIGPRAEAVGYLPGRQASLRIRGRIPIKYYQLPVTMSLAWAGRPLASFSIMTSDFGFESTISRTADEEPWGTLTITTSQHFVPNDRQKNGDRRVLSAQIYDLSLSTQPR